MTEALKGRDDVRSFLEEGRPQHPVRHPSASPTIEPTPVEERIAITVRLPKSVAHALIDASAERRKKRETAWSQQDIVTEALERLLRQSDP